MNGINALVIVLLILVYFGLSIIAAGGFTIASMRSSQISRRRGE